MQRRGPMAFRAWVSRPRFERILQEQLSLEKVRAPYLQELSLPPAIPVNGPLAVLLLIRCIASCSFAQDATGYRNFSLSPAFCPPFRGGCVLSFLLVSSAKMRSIAWCRRSPAWRGWTPDTRSLQPFSRAEIAAPDRAGRADDGCVVEARNLGYELTAALQKARSG